MSVTLSEYCMQMTDSSAFLNRQLSGDSRLLGIGISMARNRAVPERWIRDSLISQHSSNHESII